MKKGKLLVISGFSGVGKGTVVNYLKEHKDTYKVSVSVILPKPFHSMSACATTKAQKYRHA